MDYIYPDDRLVIFITEQWGRIQEALHGNRETNLSEVERKELTEKPVFPNQTLLKMILDVVYHASFRTEESRRIAVRVAYLPPGITERNGKYHLMYKPIALTRPINFTVDEVMRLAPALDATRSMILVCPSELVLSEGEHPLVIWGLYHQGSEWWRMLTGKESAAICPPNCLTVSSFSPGNITATTLGRVIFRLRDGQLQDTRLDWTSSLGLSGGNVGSYFGDAVRLLYHDVCRTLGTTKYSDEEDTDQTPGFRYFLTLENIANITAERKHGGAFIFVPKKDYLDSTSVKNSLAVKYRIDASNIWDELVSECVAEKRYYDLLFPEREKHTSLTSMSDASASDLKSLIDWEQKMKSAEQKIAEFASFVSSLSLVDGAVVVTKRLEVLGFGAEITIDSPGPVDVRVAKEPFGKEYTKKPVTAYGTRHRSAFRLCGNFEDFLCLVISQDGTIRVVRGIRGNTYLWDDLHRSGSGL